MTLLLVSVMYSLRSPCGGYKAWDCSRIHVQAQMIFELIVFSEISMFSLFSLIFLINILGVTIVWVTLATKWPMELVFSSKSWYMLVLISYSRSPDRGMSHWTPSAWITSHTPML